MKGNTVITPYSSSGHHHRVSGLQSESCFDRPMMVHPANWPPAQPHPAASPTDRTFPSNTAPFTDPAQAVAPGEKRQRLHGGYKGKIGAPLLKVLKTLRVELWSLWWGDEVRRCGMIALAVTNSLTESDDGVARLGSLSGPSGSQGSTTPFLMCHMLKEFSSALWELNPHNFEITNTYSFCSFSQLTALPRAT
ncbi:hypothetical protein MHYP_G00228510 [Metynnis hypsauchen]